MQPENTASTPRTDTASTPVHEPLEDFRLDKSKGRARDSGNYQRTVATEVERFTCWYRDQHDRPPRFADLDVQVFRAYARALRSGQYHDLDGQPARSTVLTNYACLSAYIGWCVDEEYLNEHYADNDTARDPLPGDDGRRSGDQQAWTPTQRQQLLQYVNQQTHALVDDASTGELDEAQLVKWRRDRALVHVLAYSGVRGAELLRDRNDDRREGVTWRDVSLADNRMTVLAKRQHETWSDRSLADQAIRPLELLRELVGPPSDDWPVFPTLHYPTLYGTLREADGGPDDPGALDEHPILVCRDAGVTPPSMTTAGARSRLEALTNAAGIDVDDEHGYLTLHGARRGIGEVMVREKGFAAAARLLDDTERMVRERYSHIEAGELAAEVTEAIERHES